MNVHYLHNIVPENLASIIGHSNTKSTNNIERKRWIMIIYRQYELKRTNHDSTKLIRKSIKAATYLITILKSLNLCYASEITSLKLISMHQTSQ